MRARLGKAVLISAVVSGLGAGAASAATLVVDNTPASQCKKGAATYTTIQEAVDASVTNGTVAVCPGTYPEQVTITTPGLKLLANVNGTPTVTPPFFEGVPEGGSERLATPGHALIDVDGASNAMVRGFVVKGPSADGQDIRYGIFVHGDAKNVRVTNDTVRDILSGAQQEGNNNGTGIAFGDPEGGQGTGSGIIQDNTVTNAAYDSIGIYSPGSTVTVTRNTISAAKSVQNLPVYGIDFSTDTKTSIVGNVISSQDVGIYLGSPAPGSIVGSNRLSGNTTGINDDFSSGVTLKGNVAQGGVYGFVNQGTATGNTWRSNKATDNSEADCRDDTYGNSTGGTANTWIANIGAVAFPDAICN